jgi:hypothetical protein
MIGLAKLHRQSELFGGTCAQRRNVGQGFVTVCGWLSGAEQVQVGAVKHQDDRGHRFSPLIIFGTGRAFRPVEIKCTEWLIWSIAEAAPAVFVCGDRTLAKIAGCDLFSAEDARPENR